MMESLKEVDLSKVVELDDNTNLTGELACAGGSCEIDVDVKKMKDKEVELT
jgi:hypothetical protein